MDSAPQLFVRTDQGQKLGPLAPRSVELLVGNGVLKGHLEVSLDGEHYDVPGSFPELRPHFRQSLWTGNTENARASKGNAAEPPPPAPPVLEPAAVSAPVMVMAPPPPLESAPPPPPVEVPLAPTDNGTPPIPPAGDLTVVSALRLFALASAANVNGLFKFQLADRSIEVHFRKGNAELVSSSHDEDSALAFLVAQKLVTPEGIAKANTAQGKFGADPVSALLGLGILNAGNAFAPLAQRAVGLLVKAAAAAAGAFTFSHQEVNATKVLPLGNRWSVIADVLRRLPVPEVRRRMQDVFELPVMKSGGWVDLKELRLAPQEMRALTFFDGVRPLSKLIKDHPGDADNLMRLSLLLREVDGVSFKALAPRIQAAAPPRPAAPPGRPVVAPQAPPKLSPVAAAAPKPAPVIQVHSVPTIPGATPAPKGPVVTAAAAPPVDIQAELSLARARAEKLKTENYFEVLGLTQATDSISVKMAYFKLAKVFHPDTVPQDAPPELAKLKGDIFNVISEAYKRLGEDAGRAEYILELKSGGAGDVDVGKIFHAEELFQKSTILVKARKFADALKMLDEAIEANPDEPEFHAWRGYARFFNAPDRKSGAPEAVKEIQLALSRNARCAPAYYFLGQIAKLTGDNPGAAKHFRKTVELDPHHIDAQRELRMLGTSTRK